MQVSMLPQYVQGVMSDDPKEQFDNLEIIRKLLAKENNPPIQAVVDLGIVPRFVEFLQSDQAPLQLYQES
mgnify:CR=1 FL=1